MQHLRSTWLLRSVALLLVGALLPMLFAPSSNAPSSRAPLNPAVSSSASSSYADWLRSQLRVPADASVDRALEAAVETRAASITEFVGAFLSAYESDHPDRSAARVFVDRDLSDEALISYLQRRFTEVGGEAVLLRLRLIASTTGSTWSSGSVSAVPSRISRALHAARPSVSAFLVDAVVTSFRSLSPARPQGP
ncbi:MAG: hypothetical protein WD423_00795 [Rhodothermales bacterium]